MSWLCSYFVCLLNFVANALNVVANVVAMFLVYITIGHLLSLNVVANALNVEAIVVAMFLFCMCFVLNVVAMC